MFLLLASAQNFNYVTIQFLSVSLHGGETRFLFHTVWQKLAGSERLQPDVHLHVSSKKVWDGAFSIRRESFSPLKGEGLLPLIRYLAASFSLINYWGCISTQLVFWTTVLAGFQFIPERASYFFLKSVFLSQSICLGEKKQFKEQSIVFKQIK